MIKEIPRPICSWCENKAAIRITICAYNGNFHLTESVCNNLNCRQKAANALEEDLTYIKAAEKD